MPKKDVILNLPGFTIKSVSGLSPVVMELSYHLKPRCKYCNSTKLRKKDSFMREVMHETIGIRLSVLRFKAHKFYCRSCYRYFNQQFPGILKYQRATERLKSQIFLQHTEGISQKALAVNFKIGKATIERWYHQYYLRKNQTIANRACPRVLGIDEHFFSQSHGFATTLCDLRKHKVWDVVQGRVGVEFETYMASLPGRERVRVVCMDLSSTYRKVVRRYFPNAKIVADRFHVIRLVNQMAHLSYQSLDDGIKHNRGLLAALRTKPEHLTARLLAKRDAYFKDQPAIALIYEFKQKLHRLLMKKECTAKRCKRLIPGYLKMIKALKQSPLKPLQTLGKTLYQWREEIVRMWRFTKSNGITEGFHRKMKLIQRRAYGFRNFENYRLRVRVLCG